MIEINLLPEEFKEKAPKKSVLPTGALGKLSPKTWLIVGVSSVGAVLILFLLFLLLLPTASFQYKLNQIEDRNLHIKKDLELAKRLEKEEEETRKIVSAMDQLSKERILWARVLNDISDAVPEELRLTKVYLKEEEEKLPAKPEVKPAAEKAKPAELLEGEPEKKEAPRKAAKKVKEKAEKKIVTQYLMLEGLLSAGNDEAVINRFLENLKEAPHLAPLFSEISLVGVEIQTDGGKEFVIRCQLKERKNEV